MRHRGTSIVLAILLSAFTMAWATPPASAQLRLLPRLKALTGPEEILRHGNELELGRRWGEALAHYEEALREYPEDSTILDRMQLAKINYGIVRRYNDASFRKSLEAMGEQESLDLYGEVLLKIQSHFVYDVDWQQLVTDGSRGLQVALSNETFVAQHLRLAPTDRIDGFRQELTRTVAAQEIRDRLAAVEAVRAAGQLAQRQLRLSPTAVILEYVHRAAAALDDYSTYLTADQLNELYSQIDGNFVGLGVELQADQGALLIVKVIEGSPAERGGIRGGDRIMAVDGKPTAGLSTETAAAMLQGVEGTLVEISVQAAGGAVRRIRLRRQQVEVPSVDQVKMLDAKAGIAFLRLTSFQKTTPKELDDALWKLHREGMRSLVLDLRGNPGGLLPTSVEVADRFISSGRIVSTRGRSPDQNWTYSAHKAGTWRMPLVVLIDHDSASASEILAGAIRDHRRGPIVGQNSYGKGSVQSIFPLSHGNAGLRLTTAKFYSPNGLPYSKVGVAPNVVVQQAAKPEGGSLKILTAQEDPVVAEAVRIARSEAPVQ